MHIFRGRALSSWLSLFFYYPSHFVESIYPSMCSVLSTIIQKRGRLLVQYFPSSVLEIVNRNRHGLICLLVHTERNSRCKPEKNVVFGMKFGERHWRLSVLQRRSSYICWRCVDDKIDEKELTPRKFIAEVNQLVRSFCPKKLTTTNESRRRGEDVILFLLFSLLIIWVIGPPYY